MVCYFLSPWQLEVKESRHLFTGTSFLGRGFRLAKLYLKVNKAFLETVQSEDKNHDNDTKH